jgi:hypothetical protein
MELTDYFRILRQRGWLIIAADGPDGRGGVWLQQDADAGLPIQSADAGAAVAHRLRPGPGGQGAAQQLQQWLYSSYRAQDVINNLQLDMTPGELLSDVRVASDGNSFVISLSVDNTDPNLANDIARAWANLLIMGRTPTTTAEPGRPHHDRVYRRPAGRAGAAEHEDQHRRRGRLWPVAGRGPHLPAGVAGLGRHAPRRGRGALSRIFRLSARSRSKYEWLQGSGAASG